MTLCLYGEGIRTWYSGGLCPRPHPQNPGAEICIWICYSSRTAGLDPNSACMEGRSTPHPSVVRRVFILQPQESISLLSPNWPFSRDLRAQGLHPAPGSGPDDACQREHAGAPSAGSSPASLTPALSASYQRLLIPCIPGAPSPRQLT